MDAANATPPARSNATNIIANKRAVFLTLYSFLSTQ
jgi:hypothetical protein